MSKKSKRVEVKLIECSNWLRKPNTKFGGWTPLKVIETQGSVGAKRVASEMERLELEVAQAFEREFPYCKARQKR